MAEAVVDALLDKAMKGIDPEGDISFAFQGGEPTLAGLDYFKHFVAKAKKKKVPRSSSPFRHSNQWAYFGFGMGKILS